MQSNLGIVLYIFAHMRVIVLSEAELDAKLQALKNEIISAITSEPKPEDSKERDFYTTSEIRRLLNISNTTIWHWERKGLLKPVIIGRKKIYNKAEVGELLEAKTLKKRG